MKLYYLPLIFCFLLSLNSCSETENTIEDLWIKASPETLTLIPEEGGTFTIITTSNFDNKLTAKYSNWITLESMEATPEGDKYTFKVDRNKSTDKKNGEVQFTARGALKRIEVVQAAAPDLLNFILDKETITLDNPYEAEISITVFYDVIDVEFNVTTESWITQVSKTPFTGEEESGWIYKFKIEENTETLLRNSNIVFENPNNSGVTKSVNISQPAEPSDGEIDKNFTPTEQVYKLEIEKAYASYGTHNNTLDPGNASVQLVCDGNPNTSFSGPYGKEDAVLYNPEVYNQYFAEFQKWPMASGTLSKVYPLANGGNYLILTLADNNESIDYMKFYPHSSAHGRWGKTDIWISTTADGDDFIKVKNQLDFLYISTGFVWIPLTKEVIIKGAKRVKIAIYDATGEYIRASEIEFYSAEN